MIPIYVISLDRRPRRLLAFQAANPDITFQHFSAIDGNEKPREDWIKSGLITSDNTYSMGAIGCAMSHVALWRQCVSSGQPCHILEDDVCLRNDFITASEILLSSVTDWDIVCWTWNFDWPVRFWPGQGLPSAQLLMDPYAIKAASREFQSDSGPARLYRLIYMAGTANYSISPSGATKLLQCCPPFGAGRVWVTTDPGHGFQWSNDGVDVELSRHYRNLRAFVCIPPLSVTTNDMAVSTIRADCHLA